MAGRYYGSLDLSEILEAANKKHSAFSRAKNGRVYFNVNVYINDAPDKFGNQMKLVLSSSKDAYKNEGKIFIGNLREAKPTEGQPQKKKGETKTVYDDGLPF